MIRTSSIALAVVLAACATPTIAGEITGNGKDVTIHGNSLCAYSGINDTPDGLVIQVAPGVFVQIDPGGHVQSYGYFYAQQDFIDSPSSEAARDAFAFPGVGCNPNRTPGGH